MHSLSVTLAGIAALRTGISRVYDAGRVRSLARGAVWDGDSGEKEYTEYMCAGKACGRIMTGKIRNRVYAPSDASISFNPRIVRLVLPLCRSVFLVFSVLACSPINCISFSQ